MIIAISLKMRCGDISINNQFIHLNLKVLVGLPFRPLRHETIKLESLRPEIKSLLIDLGPIERLRPVAKTSQTTRGQL